MKKQVASLSVIAALTLGLGALQLSAPIAQGADNPTGTPGTTPGGPSTTPTTPTAPTTPTTPSNPSTPRAPSTPGTSTIGISTAEGNLGEFLTDQQGRALYVLDQDLPRESRCTGECAQIWMPVLVSGTQTPTATGHASNGMIGTLHRPDGTTQVTYNDMPLYYYKFDQASGETRGQGVTDRYGTWFLVKADGTKLIPPTNPPTSTTPTTPTTPTAPSTPGTPSNPSSGNPGGTSTSGYPGSTVPGGSRVNADVNSDNDALSFLDPNSHSYDRDGVDRDRGYYYNHHRDNDCYYWGTCYNRGHHGGGGCGYYSCYYNGYCCDYCGHCYYRGYYY